jgi:hypothetical protein
MEDIVSLIERRIAPGTVIPKPAARGDFLVKGWGMRRGERALIYSIPNHNTPARPHEKGIAVSEWRQAFAQLRDNGDFMRSWFRRSMPGCTSEGSCNFTTIGGIFELLGYAVHEQGSYRRK